MITLDLVQGTSNWLAARAKHFTASEAPAMLGLSKYKTRSELLREKATGIISEVDDATQRRFNAGHEAEARARVWAETAIGEELFPVTGVAMIEGLPLLASFDGLTMDDSIAWETKSWNQEFARQVSNGEVPDTHWPQLEQQLLISGAEKVLFTVTNGDDAIEYVWYTSKPERRAKLIAGWKMFAEDVKNYVHVEAEPKVVTGPVETLPAIFVTVEGRVADSNLPAFVQAAHEYIGRIKTDLVTDADFELAAKNVNELESGEKRLEAVKANALAQTSSIDELFRAIDQIKGEMKKKRLHLTDLVKTKKESRKIQIITEAKQAMVNHVMQLNQRIGGAWMPLFNDAPFAEAIKGLKSIDSMREKVGNALRDAMLEANMLADTIQANREACADCMHLFPDFGAMCQKEYNDFLNLMGARKAEAERRESERMEAEREKIRAEEQAKAEREAQAKAMAEQAERDAEAYRVRVAEQAQLEQEKQRMLAYAEAAEIKQKMLEADMKLADQFGANVAKVILDGFNQDIRKVTEMPWIADAKVDNGATITLGRISAILGFNLTAMFLEQLGFKPHAHDKAAKLYLERDFPMICAALVRHIQSCAMREAE